MNERIKMIAVIVIYNKKIAQSITCQRIKEANKDNLDILVIDNSTLVNNNETACKEQNIRYVSMEGNKGLSKAYNVAIDLCNEKYDLIILMDDDTDFPLDYFFILEEACVKHPDVDIFTPIVYGQDGVIYSPNEFNFLRNHFIKDKNQNVSQDKFNAISSMLAIRMRVFKDYRFNEVLFVDQVDQNFFCDQREKNRKFMKLECEIHQNFYQRGDALTPEAGWNRLKMRIVDIMRHARLLGGGKYTVLGFIKCCGLGLQIGKKCKSFNIPIKAFCLSCKSLLCFRL